MARRPHHETPEDVRNVIRAIDEVILATVAALHPGDVDNEDDSVAADQLRARIFRSIADTYEQKAKYYESRVRTSRSTGGT